MKLIIVLALLQLAFCGHIYVSDIQLSYQNTGYLTSAQLYFKLENELQSSEILKITWPYQFNGTVKATIQIAGSVTKKLDAATVSQGSTDTSYLITMSQQLDAGQWYTLNLSTSAVQTPAAQYYNTPIKMSTHSGNSGTSTEGYLMYDYNNMCGFIAVSSTPVQMKSVAVSSSPTTTSVPGDNDAYKQYEQPYPIYITILTTDDYDYGGIFYITLENGFFWDGCEYFPQSCGEDDTSCTKVKTLTSKEYLCNAPSSQSVLTFARFQNTTKYAINKNEYIKIKANVKNPGRKTTSTMKVKLVSHYSQLIYEYIDTQTVLQTKLIALNSGDALYLWKLPFNEALTSGCPVRIYTSTEVAVWNKIWLPFAPNQTLPNNAQGYKLSALVTTATLINDLSIYTDATALSSSAINCFSVKGVEAADSYIYCQNLAPLQANVTKYLQFAFTMATTDFNVDKLKNFGNMKISFMDREEDITEGKTPSKIALTAAKKSVMYSTANAVVSKASATIADVFNDTNTAFRNSIVAPSSGSIDLVFLLTTTYDLQCCGAANPNSDCTESTQAQCDAQGTFIPASLILKIIANPGALSLAHADTSNSDQTTYQGVEVLPGSATDAGKEGTFGITYTATSTSQCHFILSTATPPIDQAICSTYSNYITYIKALGNTAGEQYLFNQWHKYDNKYELHLVCYPGALNKDICGGYQNGQTNNKRGVVIKDVSLSITANPLYPSEKELDFIMCIRYTTGTTLNYNESTSIASSSLINAQLIYFRTNPTEINVENGSLFRVGILNYYNDANQNYNYVPTLLRIGGYMQQADIKDNTGIAFFFDGSNIVIDSQTFSTDFPLLPTECASTGSTKPTCKYYHSRAITDTSPQNNHLDYYPSLNAITISGKVEDKLEFNYYIPVKIKLTAFTYAFIGLLSKVSPAEASIVYKLYGSKDGYDGTNTWNNFAVAADTQITSTSLWSHGAADAVTALWAGSDWENTLDPSTKYGTANTPTSAAFIKATDCYAQTGSIYPESTGESASITATTTGTWADTFNDDTATLASELRFQASVHFTVHSSIPFWSSTFKWSVTNTAKKPFTGACANMAITSYYAASINATSYLIVCPYEGTYTTGDLTTKALSISNLGWTWPDYYGTNAPIGAHLRYLWTDYLGNLKGYLAEGKKGTALASCTQTDLSSVYALNTNQKKSTIGISPLSSLKLLKGSGDKSKMIIKLTTTAPTTNTETTNKCSSGIEKVLCNFVKSGSDYSFTLTNIDTVNDITISKTALTLTFWINSGSNSESPTTYTTKISGYFYDNYPSQTSSRKLILTDCSSTANWGATSTIARSITVDDLITETSIANARGYFSFKFSSANEILDESKFTIDLSLLSSANSVPMDNMRCFIYKSNGISHDFTKFDYSSLANVTIEHKLKYGTLSKPYEFPSISYEFKCTGAKMPDTIATGAKIHVSNTISSTMAEGYSADQSTKQFTSLSSQAATISMAKTFNSIGQDATYTFKVITKEVADSPATIQFKAGSYLYVEFAKDISPRFNKLGIIRCYQESDPTYCQYESERRIAFIVRNDLNHNKTSGHNFSIVGVSQPAELLNNKIMYFALVPYLGTFKALQFQDNSTNSDSIPTSSSTVNLLPVTHYEQSTTEIRSTFTFTMNIKFPINSVQDNIPIWVDLPEEFDEATFFGWTPNCKLQNIKVLYNEVIDNYVSSCSMNSTRRIKIIMKNATYSSQKLFQLQVSAIPTYNYEQYNVNAPLVWFGTSESPLTPLYKTNLGSFNGTSNLATFTYSESQYKLMTWKSTSLTCIIGTYQCSASLIPQKFDRFYLDLDAITSSGSHSSYFSFNPSKISVKTGKAETGFEIAPKASTAPGLYQLKWTHDAPTSYYVIPPLFIVALNSQMKPATDQANYEVPDGGKSLPIIFNFKDMMPENDVTLTGVAETLSTISSKYETSAYVSFESASQTLTYSETSEQTQIQFVVKGTKGTTTGTELPTARISWTVSGTNAKSYSTPSTNTISVVEAPVGIPELTINTPDSTLVGYQTFVAQCSHVGVLYYVTSQDQAKTQIEYTSIQSATEAKNIKETEVETVYTNPSRTFYGYHSITTANTDNSIIIQKKFQSQAKYFMRMFCVNLVSTASEAKEVSWTQASNNGKPMITTMQFLNSNVTANQTTYISLNDTQRKEITCFICKETQIEKERVFAINGVACGEQGVVSTANTTTANTTSRMLIVENATSEYFVVMPDLFAIDGSLENTKTKIESDAFKTTLSASPALAQVRLQDIACSINSAYPSLPYISSPSVSPSEQSITFTWTGANNTDGFVFVGVVETLNGTVTPTELQLKKNSGYTFAGFNKAFYNKDTSVSASVTSLTKCSDYSYYWVATNEDPDTYQYSTGIKTGTTKTIGCPTFASSLAMKMLGFLVLLALLL